MNRTRYSTAIREVHAKSDATIERETAQKWLARAVACCRERTTASGAAREEWSRRAWEYRAEALEHAALVGDGGRTVAAIEGEIDREMSKCGMRARRR